jgi:broad specificity phosphatase PhoE
VRLTGSTLLFIPHAEALPRSGWDGDHDERPLHPRGLRQAARLADAIGPVDGVYSSPARRCVQTVEPLAGLSAVPVVPLEELREATSPPRSWDRHLTDAMRLAVHGASVAGRVVPALDRPGTRVAFCSHGDTIPIVIAYLAARHGVELPALVDRGGWYELAGGTISAHGPVLE